MKVAVVYSLDEKNEPVTDVVLTNESDQEAAEDAVRKWWIVNGAGSDSDLLDEIDRILDGEDEQTAIQWIDNPVVL